MRAVFHRMQMRQPISERYRILQYAFGGEFVLVLFEQIVERAVRVPFEDEHVARFGGLGEEVRPKERFEREMRTTLDDGRAYRECSDAERDRFRRSRVRVRTRCESELRTFLLLDTVDQ